MHRRQFLAATGLAAVAGCVGGPASDVTSTTDATPTTPGAVETTTASSTTETAAPPSTVGLETVVDGLRTPVDVAFAPDESRQYVAEQRGVVRVVADGDVLSTPLLDLRDAVVTGSEMGLLGIALHPEDSSRRRLLVRYSAPRRDGTPSEYSHTFVLAAFRVSADGRRVDRDSERTILTVPQPQGNHNAGSLAFGPDGCLYVGTGDGGSGGDQGRGHVEDWYDAVPGGNGQDVTENLLGGILRIDVDDAPDGDPYGVPDDNPLVGDAGRDEYYAWGFRNPWRFAFDGSDLLVGDVGQNRYEEVDLVRRGGNYGWNVREGRHCYGADECPGRTPESVRGGEPLLDPVIEYPHGDDPVSGVSVIGGNVYRGDALPGLRGQYVFGDYAADGRLFVATPREEGLWPTRTLPLADGDADALSRLYSIQRHDGELYVLSEGEAGGFHRLQQA